MNDEQLENAAAVPATGEPAAENEAPSETTQKGARPIMKFGGSGGVVVAIWKAKSKEGYDYFNVTIDRTYRNDEGKFVTVDSLRDSDLLRTQRLLGQADEWIEQEKAKGRRASAATSGASASAGR